jgi:hypothetical protein
MEIMEIMEISEFPNFHQCATTSTMPNKRRRTELDEPSHDYEALVMALTLAVTAPSEEQAVAVIEIAENIAERLTEEEVERAKAMVSLHQSRN